MVCCCSKVKELRVVVIGGVNAKKKEVIETIQSHSKLESTKSCCETRVNICCCLSKVQGHPVNIDELDMVLFDTLGLDDAECTEDPIKEIMECISKSARHVFLLVLNSGRLRKGNREMVENIKATFGDQVTDNMIIVFKGDAEPDQRKEIEESMTNPKPNPDSSNHYLKDLQLDCNERVVFLYGDKDHDKAEISQIKCHINDIIKETKEKCYTHKMMMMAQCKAEKNEKLPLPVKIGLLLGLWLGALLGVVFFGKDFLQTGVVLGGGLGGIMGKAGPAIRKSIRDRL